VPAIPPTKESALHPFLSTTACPKEWPPSCHLHLHACRWRLPAFDPVVQSKPKQGDHSAADHSLLRDARRRQSCRLVPYFKAGRSCAHPRHQCRRSPPRLAQGPPAPGSWPSWTGGGGHVSACRCGRPVESRSWRKPAQKLSNSGCCKGCKLALLSDAQGKRSRRSFFPSVSPMSPHHRLSIPSESDGPFFPAALKAPSLRSG